MEVVILRSVLVTVIGLLLLCRTALCNMTLPSKAAAKACQQDDMCSCTYDDGTVIDITSLGLADNSPRFKDVKSETEGNFYSYNPCYPFNEKSCANAAVCILNADQSESILIGDANRAGFQYNAEIGHVVAAYTSGTIRDLRLSEVILVCDESACDPTIVANGQQSSGEFQLTMTTVCACPNGCSKSGPKNCVSGGQGGLSGGSILCIAFLSVMILYAVIGTVFMKFVKKKDGIEVIPHVTFWRTLPIHVKGGVMFLVGKCHRKRSKYDSI